MKKLEIVLGIIIILLVLVIISIFVFNPMITNYNNKLRTEGIEYAVITIMQQAATCQIVPLTFDNQTVEIIAINCLQTS